MISWSTSTDNIVLSERERRYKPDMNLKFSLTSLSYPSWKACIVTFEMSSSKTLIFLFSLTCSTVFTGPKNLMIYDEESDKNL